MEVIKIFFRDVSKFKSNGSLKTSQNTMCLGNMIQYGCIVNVSNTRHICTQDDIKGDKRTQHNVSTTFRERST